MSTEYLGCKILGENIAIPAAQVQEVFETRLLTRLPGVPLFIIGMVNVRGSVLPVLDPWDALPSSPPVRKIVILKTGLGLVGLLITALSDLIRFDKEEPAPHVPADLKKFERYITGIGIHDERHFILDGCALTGEAVKNK